MNLLVDFKKFSERTGDISTYGNGHTELNIVTAIGGRKLVQDDVTLLKLLLTLACVPDSPLEFFPGV
jgi:hypothetical protein